jgi:hypothetical protein
MCSLDLAEVAAGEERVAGEATVFLYKLLRMGLRQSAQARGEMKGFIAISKSSNFTERPSVCFVSQLWVEVDTYAEEYRASAAIGPPPSGCARFAFQYQGRLIGCQ